MDFIQHAHEWRAEKSAGLLFVYDNITRLGRDLFDNLIGFLPLRGHIFRGSVARGRPTANQSRTVGAILLGGGVESRQMFFTRCGEQLADVINPVPSFLAA